MDPDPAPPARALEPELAGRLLSNTITNEKL